MSTDPPLHPDNEASFSDLWRLPGMRPLALSVGLSRWVLDGMLPITLVLTCLKTFGSPAIAGLVVLLGTLPGLALTPFAGALLDRRGREREVPLMVTGALVTALGSMLVLVAPGLPLIAVGMVVVGGRRRSLLGGAVRSAPAAHRATHVRPRLRAFLRRQRGWPAVGIRDSRLVEQRRRRNACPRFGDSRAVACHCRSAPYTSGCLALIAGRRTLQLVPQIRNPCRLSARPSSRRTKSRSARADIRMESGFSVAQRCRA